MEYVRFLDRKGRLVIPTEFRKKVIERVIITGCFKNHLRLYTPKDWEKLVKKWQELPFKIKTPPETRRFLRVAFSQSTEAVIDNWGRVLIPGYLREYVSLSREVRVVIGDDCLEIWNEKKEKKKERR